MMKAAVFEKPGVIKIKETIVIGSNYSLFGKGTSKLFAVKPEDSALLA